MSQYVYFFGRKEGKDFTEGSKEMKKILGGKGANLAEMTKLGMPVPAGFTISAASQKHWVANDDIKKEVLKQYKAKLKQLEDFHGQKLGDILLVSVRSGAAVSMPGMMDTVLNLGIHDSVIEKLIEKFEGKARFVWDSYRRFIQMFSNIAMEIDLSNFENVLHKIREEYNVKFDKDIPVEGLKKCVDEYKKVFKEKAKRDFPQDPYEQLDIAVSAVFKSWYNERAIHYRKMNKIYEDEVPGTAVNVQTMVFGNMNDESGTGVAFSRDPANGTRLLFGEFLINAQGEDVVAGIRTPLKIEQMKEKFPESYKYLVECCGKLEKHYKAVQDMEFTIQNNKFYFLQTRNGKLTGHAMSAILTDMVKEGLITKKRSCFKDRHRTN
jgi:pyruvate,orthophosphate dikinase